MEYNHQKIEKKWQDYWEKNEMFKAEEKEGKKHYFLVEFPYPSGAGLHVGHCRSYTAMDIIARKRRMQGENVIFPMGWDAFGLPTENYAIKTNTHPKIVTKENTDNFRRQEKSLGFSFDWSREINTTDPKYYKWTQWIFKKLYENDMAYKDKISINWCTSCKIGLANEEVVDNSCERCGGEVVKKEKEQWMLKITKYADRLLSDLDKLDYPDRVKALQRDWIGRSEGADIKFKTDKGEEITVFTTRPDTIFGATFLVLAPEHNIIQKLRKNIENIEEVEEYINVSKKKTEIERSNQEKEKTGVKLVGISAINPVNNKEIPIFIADYVMMGYGHGAIMAVPGHDERDNAFAEKYGLEIRQVITPFLEGTGDLKVRDDKETKKREVVYVYVQYKDKLLMLDWKVSDYGTTCVVGGVEEGETLEETAKREVQEETGYKNIKLIRKLNTKVHQTFYAPHKDCNRYAVSNILLFELENEERDELPKEELDLHGVVWIDRNKLEEKVTLGSQKTFWDMLQKPDCYSGDGININSDFLDNLKTDKSKEKIISWLEEKEIGKKQITYKLRDWVFSRQRYWGEPIPMIWCDTCGWVVDDKLPVELPEIDDYMPTYDGDSPLAKTDWVHVKCPKCNKMARRETDVMPNWAGSNWYFLRYTDANNNDELASAERLKYWIPVDWYNGGMEHTTLHLLYSRFIYKFLYDIGAIPKECGDEPYKKRTSHGMILGEGGIKMSKSKGNVINPDDVVEAYGADTLRMYEMFMGPFSQAIAWSEKGLLGSKRFLDRVWNIIPQVKIGENKEIDKLFHKTIKKITEDVEGMKFNTAVSSLMILLNAIEKSDMISNEAKEGFIILLSPFAPHISEEMWSKINDTSVMKESWPEYNKELVMDDEISLIVQVNGRLRDTISVEKDITEEDAKELVIKNEKISKWINGDIKKVIFVPGRLINIVV